MTKKKPEKEKPRNFWLEGDVALSDLPEIKKGLRHLLKHHPDLKAAHEKHDSMPWKQQPDGFVGLVNIIAAQQISTAAAGTILTRLHKAIPNMTPRKIMKTDDNVLRAAGFSSSKIAYTRHLAESIISRKFNPADLPDMELDDAFKALTSLKGIGLWSAEIYLMFSLGRGDVWPAGDIALQKGIQRLEHLIDRPTPDETRRISERWSPHRSAAALIIWRA